MVYIALFKRSQQPSGGPSKQSFGHDPFYYRKVFLQLNTLTYLMPNHSIVPISILAKLL